MWSKREDRHRPPISGADESSMVTTNKTSGSHHHGNPRTNIKRRTTINKIRKRRAKELKPEKSNQVDSVSYPTNFSSTFSISCSPSINSYRQVLSPNAGYASGRSSLKLSFTHVSTAIVSSNDACEKSIPRFED